MRNLFPHALRSLFSVLRALAGITLLAVLGFTSRGTAAITAANAADWHTFTNDSGSSFKAQITGVTGDVVLLKREDGQVFQPKVAIFSKDDQSFIRLWVVRRATQNDDKLFSFHTTTVKSDIASRIVSSTLSRVPTNPTAQVTTMTDVVTQIILNSWRENYKVEVKNLTAINWSSLHFRYIVFMPGVTAGNGPGKQSLAGAFDVDKYPGDENKTFSLESVAVEESRTSINGVSSDGGKAPASGLAGLWIRVYDDTGNLLQEWASDPKILKSERWDFPRTVTPPAVPTSPPGPGYSK